VCHIHNGCIVCRQLHISHCIMTVYCDIAGVHTYTRTFHRCRAAAPAGQDFIINECLVGQVMNIQSAEVGYSVLYYPNTNPPQCPMNNCTRSTDVPAKRCHGYRTCAISQEIVIYPQGSDSTLCDLSRDGNFIRIRFTCVTSTIFFNVSVTCRCIQYKILQYHGLFSVL